MVKLKEKTHEEKHLTRKEQRKLKHRKEKEKRHMYFSKKLNAKKMIDGIQNRVTSAKIKKPSLKEPLFKAEVQENDAANDLDFTDNKKLKLQKARKEDRKSHSQITVVDAVELRKNDLRRQKELQNTAQKLRIRQLKAENVEEDRKIAQLERKLKLNKSKDKRRLVRKMFNDGLDYALEICLGDEDSDNKKQKKDKLRPQNNDSGWLEENDSNDESYCSLSGNELDMGKESMTEEYSDSENGNDDKGAAEKEMDKSKDGEKKKQQMVKKEIEDIYGRKRDKDGNVIISNNNVKYVPPHHRAMFALQNNNKHSQTMELLLKQCKGLLNRLSESNLHKIATGIEKLYMNNSRNNMNETLAKLLKEALITRTMTNDRMIQEHMAVLAFLHASVGSEIGAHFLQVFICAFDKFVCEIADLAVEDKRANNLILVLVYMYIFKIYDHCLLIELINKLKEKLCEKSIECLLLLFQSVGLKLRKDDPLAFKQLMIAIQNTIAASPISLKKNMRLKFMVDILNAIKNNNIQKIAKFDPELAENLRKTLKAMLRNDKYVITLKISYNDLIRAEQSGKWWIVGSAWSGNNDKNDGCDVVEKCKNKSMNASRQLYSEKLLELSKKQKMNTEERRNIFCIIMSAEDYVDAFEKILHLCLKDQRIVAYVVVQCCLNEKHSNPYYSYLTLKFCQFNRKYQLAFQFAIWDRIKDIKLLSKQQIRNLSNFLQHLFLKGGLSLSVLKVVDFLQLDNLSMLLMKKIMVGLLLAENGSEVYQTFERIATNGANPTQFRSNIRLFIQHFLLQQHEGNKLKLNDDQLVLLQKRAYRVDHLLVAMEL